MAQARLEMSLTAPSYGVNLTSANGGIPTNFRPSTVGYYETVNYATIFSGTTTGGNAIFDRYGRVVGAGGWGNSTSGAVWGAPNAAPTDFSVDGTNGRVTLSSTGTTRRIEISLNSFVNVNLLASIAVSQTATGPVGSLIGTGLVARSDGTGNNLYTARLIFSLAGNLTLQINKVVGGAETNLGSFSVGSYIPNQFWWLRFSVDGNTLQAKAWLNGVTEPANYQITVSDTSLPGTGAIGTRTFMTAGTTNASPIAFYGDFVLDNVFFDVLRALYFAPQRFGENWTVNRVTVNDTATTQVPTVFIMRGLVRPQTAFNLNSFAYPHQIPTLLATSALMDFTPSGTNDVADITTPIQLSPGEYFTVIFAGAQYPDPAGIQTSTVFVGGTTTR